MTSRIVVSNFYERNPSQFSTQKQKAKRQKRKSKVDTKKSTPTTHHSRRGSLARPFSDVDEVSGISPFSSYFTQVLPPQLPVQVLPAPVLPAPSILPPPPAISSSIMPPVPAVIPPVPDPMIEIMTAALIVYLLIGGINWTFFNFSTLQNQNINQKQRIKNEQYITKQLSIFRFDKSSSRRSGKQRSCKTQKKIDEFPIKKIHILSNQIFLKFQGSSLIVLLFLTDIDAVLPMMHSR